MIVNMIGSVLTGQKRGELAKIIIGRSCGDDSGFGFVTSERKLYPFHETSFAEKSPSTQKYIGAF